MFEKYGAIRADGRDACVEMESDESNAVTKMEVASAEGCHISPRLSLHPFYRQTIPSSRFPMSNYGVCFSTAIRALVLQTFLAVSRVDSLTTCILPSSFMDFISFGVLSVRT